MSVSTGPCGRSAGAIGRTALLLAVALAVPGVGARVAPPGLAAQEPAFEDGGRATAADSAVGAALEEAGIPGAVVVAVREGRIVLSEGYGFASLERGVPMSDSTTVFAVASLAKPITAAAALRLVERGDLTLGEDIRPRVASLDLPIRHDEPITLLHLLTHTAGFDDTEFGDAARSGEEAVPLGERLRRMPAQSFAPGRLYRYSNHGYALAGWVLQEASGSDFPTLVDRLVFAPLGMASSSIEQVASADLEARMATGYVRTRQGSRAVEADYSNVAPADALLTTGRDMARFLLALTDTGTAEHWSASVRERMLETAFTYHDSLPGVTPAFQVRPVHDWRGLEHTGGRTGFTAQLVLVPEKHFGLFVALNMRDGGVRSALTSRLLDVFLPEEQGRLPMAEEDAPDPVTPPSRLIGDYRSIRYNRRTVEKVAVLLGLVPTVTVEDAPGKALRIGGGDFYEVGPLLFRWKDARWYNAFLAPDDGPTLLISGHQGFERVEWWQDAGLHRALVAATATILLGLLLLTGWRWLFRRRSTTGPRRGSAGSWALRLLSTTSLTILTGGALLAAALSDLETTADYGAPTLLKAALAALSIGAVLTVPAVVVTTTALLRGEESLGTRLALAAGAVATILMVALLSYWNLLGFRY